MAGDLIAANRILDKDEDELFVCIADGTEYVLLNLNEGWKYEKQPKTRLLFAEGMKGIPLSVELVTGCGFQLKPRNALINHACSEPVAVNYYSLEGFTVISSELRRTVTFTDNTVNLRIQFVHELQNLYFKVMNKELDITVPPFNFQIMSKLY